MQLRARRSSVQTAVRLNPGPARPSVQSAGHGGPESPDSSSDRSPQGDWPGEDSKAAVSAKAQEAGLAQACCPGGLSLRPCPVFVQVEPRAEAVGTGPPEPPHWWKHLALGLGRFAPGWWYPHNGPAPELRKAQVTVTRGTQAHGSLAGSFFRENPRWVCLGQQRLGSYLGHSLGKADTGPGRWGGRCRCLGGRVRTRCPSARCRPASRGNLQPRASTASQPQGTMQEPTLTPT